MHQLRRTMAMTILALATAAGVAPAANAGTLIATVGTGYTISLTTGSGTPVRSVRAGTTHTVIVRDRARDHNFRLVGPGYTRQTGVASVATHRWTVTFTRGSWSFICQPHAGSMRGTFQAM